MGTILTTYLRRYQLAFRKREEHVCLFLAVGEFTRRYSDHTASISERLGFLSRYRLPMTSTLAQCSLREAYFFFLLALEDVRGLDYLARLHPAKERYLGHEVALHFSRLSDLESSLRRYFFSPPSRSA